MKKLLGKPVILPVLVVIAIIITVVVVKTRPGVQHQDLTMQPRSVQVIHANTIPTRVQAVGYGTVEPAVDLVSRAEVSGKISYIHPQLKKGDSLPNDAVALRIDPVDYELSLSERKAGLRSSQSVLEQLEVEEKSAQRSLKLARENLAVGETELKRKRAIREKGLIAKTEVDAEEQKVLSLRQTVEDLKGKLEAFASRKAATRAQVEQSEAQVEGQEETLGRTEIRMPFDARIGDVSVEKGEFVNVGSELFRASNLDGVEITAQLPIKHIRPLVATLHGSEHIQQSGPINLKMLLERLGLEARVRLAGDDFDQAVWQGRVVRFSESVDPTRRTAGVVVAVDKPYEKMIPGKRPPLLKGMYVAVELLSPEISMQVIPRHALHQGKVYVVDGQNHLDIRPVTVSMVQDEIAIISGGLQEGDVVIVTDLVPVIKGMPLKAMHDEAMQQRIMQLAAAKAS